VQGFRPAHFVPLILSITSRASVGTRTSKDNRAILGMLRATNLLANLERWRTPDDNATILGTTFVRVRTQAKSEHRD
jgi:hypothetical protein